MQETVEETTALADWRHRIGLCGLEEEAERIGRKMAALGLRGDGTRDETRRGGGGAPKGSGTRRCIDRLRNRNLMRNKWPRFIGSLPVHPLSKLGM